MGQGWSGRGGGEKEDWIGGGGDGAPVSNEYIGSGVSCALSSNLEKSLRLCSFAQRRVTKAFLHNPSVKGGGGGGSGGETMDSGCHMLSENIWFVWLKTSHGGVNVGCHAV